MRRLFKITFLFFILAGFAVSAHAQKGQDVPPAQRAMMQKQRAQMHHESMLRLPGLTDAQKAEIKGIHLSAQKETLPLENLMREKKARLRTLQTAEKYDEGQVNTVIDEITDLQASLMKVRSSHHQQVRALLNEEQRILFDSQMPKRMDRMSRPKRSSRRDGKKQ